MFIGARLLEIYYYGRVDDGCWAAFKCVLCGKWCSCRCHVSLSTSLSLYLAAAYPPEVGEKRRFQTELEFVQCLANPHYLNCEPWLNESNDHVYPGLMRVMTTCTLA